MATPNTATHLSHCSFSSFALTSRPAAVLPPTAGGNAELLLNQLLKHTAVQTRCVLAAHSSGIPGGQACFMAHLLCCQAKGARGAGPPRRPALEPSAPALAPSGLAPTWSPWWVPSRAPSRSRTSCSISWTSGADMACQLASTPLFILNSPAREHASALPSLRRLAPGARSLPAAGSRAHAPCVTLGGRPALGDGQRVPCFCRRVADLRGATTPCCADAR